MTFNKILFALLFFTFSALSLSEASAQTCNPTAAFSYTNDDGEAIVDEEAENYSGSAPVKGVFRANPDGVDDYAARYEWVIYESTKSDEVIVHRFDENLEYTFLHSGSFIVELKATFVLDGDTIAYPAEGEKPATFSVSVKQSQLEMPNAFSPNGDSWNNTYRVKKHQSIVEFKATIFNRWGQKLYSWDDVNGEWDGKVNGKVVKDGVYFVNVVAKGADGRVYHIRKDINVLTRIESTGGDSGGTE